MSGPPASDACLSLMRTASSLPLRERVGRDPAKAAHRRQAAEAAKAHARHQALSRPRAVAKDVEAAAIPTRLLRRPVRNTQPSASPSQPRTPCASLLTPDPLLLKFGRFSLPEKAPPVRSDDDDFRDPPDIRFPNVWESSRSPLEVDLSRLVRASPGLAPRPKAKGGA